MKCYPLLKGYDGPEDSPVLFGVFSTFDKALAEARRLQIEDSNRHTYNYGKHLLRWQVAKIHNDILFRHESFIRFEEDGQEFADDVIVIRGFNMDKIYDPFSRFWIRGLNIDEIYDPFSRFWA
jgi:hypothetical protein